MASLPTFERLASRAIPISVLILLFSCGGERGLSSRQTTPEKVATPAAGDLRRPSATAQRLAQVLAESGCRGCHNPQGMASETRFIFPQQGAQLGEFEKLSTKFWELVDAADPTRSRLFLKPTKRMPHAGGERIAQDSGEEEALLAWLSEAAQGPRDAQALRDILEAPDSKLAWPVEFRGTPSLLRRLSRDEVVTTLQVLIGIAPPRAELPEEPRQGHAPLVTVGVPLLANEIRKLEVVMGDFAAKIAPEMLAQSTCNLTEEAQRSCLADWATELATRAFRRVPSVEEAAQLRGLCEGAGTSLKEDLATLEALLIAIFFSPSFLYRDERGSPIAGAPGTRALTAEELASRLSYFTTLGPPDEALLAAATAGRLADPSERLRHFDRLAASERGRQAQIVFVLEWLGANEDKINHKSDKYRKDLGEDFAPSMRKSAENAIAQVLFESRAPTVENLLLTTSYLGDEVMLKVSRPSGKGKRQAGDTDQTNRKGLMMHPQVLSAHTKENGSSPFQLGAFMREALLCEPVPAPPANAAAMARTNEPKGLSTRENLEFRTSAGPTCIGCHDTFAPLGYAFLPFDPIGRWQTQDPSGTPWNLVGTVSVSAGEPLSFATPAELLHTLASHPQVHGCFAQAALAWTLGRALVPADRPLLTALSDVATRTHGNLPAIFRAIVSAPDFTKVVATR